MNALVQEPSVGVDIQTGGRIEGFAHLQQSLQDICTTNFGMRSMREWYGSFAPRLLGGNLSTRDVTPFFAAITSAIEQWEPRYRVKQIEVVRVDGRNGKLHFFLAGEYRPRALLGDFTSEGARRLDAYANNDGIRIMERN